MRTPVILLELTLNFTSSKALPNLEETGRSIGVVQGAQGCRWFTIIVHGKDARTGITPLSTRKDPVLAASKIIAVPNEIAFRHDALVSTGIFRVPSNAPTNTLATYLTFTLDIRHPNDNIVHAVQEIIFEAFATIATQDGKGVSFDWMLDTDSPAVKFDHNCVALIQAAAEHLVDPEQSMLITSGADHDIVYTSKHCPSAMIFVPCREDVSHHPAEYCSPQYLQDFMNPMIYLDINA